MRHFLQPTAPVTTTHHTQRGFTLIEILVALSIFTIVVTISVGSLLVLVNANSKVQHLEDAVTNVSFVLDSMTRSIRTGYDFQCASTDTALTLGTNTVTPADCTTGYSNFAYTESSKGLTSGLTSNRIGYRLSGGIIQRQLSTTGWQDVTAPDVTITTLKFVTNNTSRADNLSPLVTIIIKGTVGTSANTTSSFSLQTTVTQQMLDL